MDTNILNERSTLTKKDKWEIENEKPSKQEQREIYKNLKNKKPKNKKPKKPKKS